MPDKHDRGRGERDGVHRQGRRYGSMVDLIGANVASVASRTLPLSDFHGGSASASAFSWLPRQVGSHSGQSLMLSPLSPVRSDCRCRVKAKTSASKTSATAGMAVMRSGSDRTSGSIIDENGNRSVSRRPHRAACCTREPMFPIATRPVFVKGRGAAVKPPSTAVARRICRSPSSRLAPARAPSSAKAEIVLLRTAEDAHSVWNAGALLRLMFRRCSLKPQRMRGTDGGFRRTDQPLKNGRYVR